MSGEGAPPREPSRRRWLGILLLLSVAVVAYLVGNAVGRVDAALFADEVRRSADAEREARAQVLERATRATHDDLRARLDAASKRIAELEAARAVNIDSGFSEEPATVLPPPAEARGEPSPPATPSPPPPGEEAAAEPPAPREPAPRRSLGPTAVTDPRQVKKVLDSLNALFAGLGGAESWRVVSAEAVDGDRLVGARLEGRDARGEFTRGYRAAEARFLLRTASRTLRVQMQEGEATYPGDRRAPFLEGGFGLVLEVDPAPWRNSGHPLVAVE